MSQVSVHKLLGEVKVLDARIKASFGNKFFGAVKGALRTPTHAGVKTEADLRTAVNASFQSTNALIERAQLVRATLHKANAETQVVVAGQTMSVLDAIAYKKTIDHKADFLNALRQQLTSLESVLRGNDMELEAAIERQTTAACGGDKSKVTAEAITSVRKVMEDANKLALVSGVPGTDPFAWISAEADRLLKLSEELNYTLVESNAITKVEIDLPA